MLKNIGNMMNKWCKMAFLDIKKIGIAFIYFLCMNNVQFISSHNCNFRKDLISSKYFCLLDIMNKTQGMHFSPLLRNKLLRLFLCWKGPALRRYTYIHTCRSGFQTFLLHAYATGIPKYFPEYCTKNPSFCQTITILV